MSAIPQDIAVGLHEALVAGEVDTAISFTQMALEQGLDPIAMIRHVIVPALTTVGQQFQDFEIFLGELMMSAKAAESATSLLQAEIGKRGSVIQSLGTVVIGTVQGDIHDIGKNIVATMLRAHGFDVIDLGRDVAPSTFLDEAKRNDADVIAISSLMTTTSSMQLNTINLFKEVGMRDKYRIIVGGGCVNQAWADEIGADGYSDDAVGAVELCKSLLVE
jgi:trimethylamine corrinoid protein